MSAVRTALRELATVRATGALHVEGELGAVLYLQDGEVCHVDAGAAPGVGRILTASGRLPEGIWQAAFTAGAPSGQVGALLIDQGHLNPGELELCVTGALHDAAFFALETVPTTVRFAAGEVCWFGDSVRVGVEPLCREVDRRRQILTAALPSAAFDQVALMPVRRLPRDQVVLDGLRWELLINADGRRTPLELARLLGRGGFAVLLEARRLAAAGLLQGPVVASPQPASVAAYRPAPAVGRPSAHAAQPAQPTSNGSGITAAPPLPRRRVGLSRRTPAEPGESSTPSGADDSHWPIPPPEVTAEHPTLTSLARVRDALDEFS